MLQRFERRLEGLVEGVFARAFGGVVEPVEVAAALIREAEDKKAIVGQGRVLVPNAYVVELGASDAARLAAYDVPLRAELAAMVSEHAAEQGWSFVGPVGVRFEEVQALGIGVFRVSSSAAGAREPDGSPGPEHTSTSARPHLVLPVVGGGAGERIVALDRPVFVVGRGLEADLRLDDTGVSRRHAEVRVDGSTSSVVDLASTNGTRVNGRPVSVSPLQDGDRIGVGTTELVFRSGA